MKKYKKTIESILITFTATFVLVVGMELSRDDFIFSQDTLVALAVSGTVAGVRAIARIAVDITKDLLKK